MVHIKNIRMTGFKSFGNSRTIIKLAPGFTCIVGPNGSGKSNAIDALSFCLGTLSKKSMRAQKLTDLLYSGVTKKDEASKAIVEIELDNTDLKIPVDDTTVLISRELRRNGSGVYRLNGKRTTRTNILDKLRIANIDCVDGYNIIQQGQIGEIVGMSGNQRRELLEGVAGIGQFEEKKENAIAELDEAQRKMGELNLLINELTNRVEQLKSEKEAAEKWIELGVQIKRLQSELLSLRLKIIEEEMKNLNAAFNIENQKIDEFENKKQGIVELKRLEEEVKLKQAQIDEYEQQRIENSEELNNTKIELAKLEQLKKFNKSSKEQKKEDIERFELEKKLATGSIEERQGQIQEITKQIQEIEKQKKDLTHKRSQVEEDIEERISEYKDAQGEYERITKDIRNINEDLTTLEVTKDISISVAESFQETRINKLNQLSESKKTLEITNSKITATQKEIDNDTSKLQELQNSFSENQEKLVYHETKIKGTNKKIQQHTEELIVLKTKIDMIRASLSEEEDANKAISYILTNKSKFPGTIGILETILGNEEEIPKTIRHLKNALVTEDLSSALNCIRKLKENVIGSCVFIPLKRLEIEQHNIGEELERKVTSSIIVVKDINEAIDLWHQNDTVQIQTISGDIFYPNGIIDGGFHRSAAADQLEPLEELKRSKEEDIERLVKEKEMQENTKIQIDKAKEITNEAKVNLEKTIRDAIIRLQHLNEKRSQENDQLNRLSAELSEIEKDELEKKTELDTFTREIEELTISKGRIEKKLEEAQELMDSLEVSGFREQRSRLSESIIEIEKQKIREDERKNSLEKLMIPSNQRIQQIDDEISRLLNEIENLAKKDQEIAEGIKNTIDMIWQKEQDSQGVNETIQDAKSEIVNFRREIKKTNRSNSKIEKDIQATRETINEIRIERAKLDTERDNLYNEAKEKELEIFEAEETFLDNINSDKHRSEVVQLSNSRKALEPVNMRSIEDFQGENKRLQESVETKKVLTEERKVILGLITQLEIEKLNKFMRTFNSINQSFNEIFFELANGDARLILENPEDIFEGGISIEAHPDGKTLKTLEAMSGGEKALTALAFIFAIQQSEPQPFYVLDEIDATLDIKNVDKVGRLLAKMSSGTSEFGKAQFIVISHRDILMAKAETIYGTTNVKGITQMIQLRLGEKGLTTS